VLRASDTIPSCSSAYARRAPVAANLFAPLATSVGLLLVTLRPPHPASGTIGHFRPLRSCHVAPQSGNALAPLPNQPQFGTVSTAAKRRQASDKPPLLTPLDPGLHLDMSQCPQTPKDNEFMRDKPYVSAVGVLMYLAIATRPDTVHTVGVLCRLMSKLGPAHWKAAKHLFHYLRGSVDYCLTYAPDPSSSQLFTTYSNADLGGSPDNGRSTSAYVVEISTGAVSWMLRLQSIVALSTTEAEFISAVSAGQEIVWMRLFLGELGYSFDAPSLLLVDNQSAIQVACNPKHHGRMKHLDLRFCWLRDKVNSGIIAVRYIPTVDMATDLLTKVLARVKVTAALPQLSLTAP
jgi:hypothetical protein